MKFMLGSLMIVLISMLTAPALTALLATRDKEVQTVTEPIVDNLLAGYNQGNYAQYSRDFDDTLREAIPEKKFQQVRADILKIMGKYKDKKYLGFLDRQAQTMVLWKGAFEGTPDDVLIKLVIFRQQNKVQVVGLWFQ